MESIIAFFIIGGFILVVILMVTLFRKQKQHRAEVAQTLGFTLVETPDNSLLEKIVNIHHSEEDSYFKLYNVMRKSIPYGTLYIYDLHQSSHANNNSVGMHEYSAVAIISQEMNLPRFSLSPRLGKGGRLANWANQQIENIMKKHGLNEVDFPDYPELDKKFFIFGQDASAIRGVLKDHLAELIIRKPSLIIYAGGDTLSIVDNELMGRPMKISLDAIRGLVDQALTIFSQLSRQ